MKFVSSRDIRVNPRPIFEALGEQNEIIVTSRGKPVALLVGVSGEDFEETVWLVRRARAQLAVSRMRKAAARKGLDRMSQEEIEAEITATRRERTEQR